MKKIVLSTISIGLCFILITVLMIFIISPKGEAWFMKNNIDRINNSSELLSINRGYGNNVSSFMNDENFDPSMLEALFQNNEEELDGVFLPGDVIYYSFIIQVDYSKLSSSSATTVYISLELNGGVRDTRTDNTTGFYTDFLSNLTIETNTIQLGLLEVKKDEHDEIIYDDNGDVTYDIISYTVNNEEKYFYDINNTEVPSFYTNSEIQAEFSIVLPSTSSTEYSVLDEINTYLLLLVPIWYKDTGINQNPEMDSRLNIISCIVDYD